MYRDEVFPAYCFEFADSTYYGFPSIDGAGLKLGRHDGGDVVNPNDPLRPFDASDAAGLTKTSLISLCLSMERLNTEKQVFDDTR